MSNPVIQANDSLVRNGAFLNGYKEWTPTNELWTGTASEPYEGVNIRFLTLAKQASVSQLIKVPKDVRGDTHYTLSFLYETRNTLPGRLEVTVVRTGEKQAIALDPAPPSDSQQDQYPQAFKPTSYHEELKLALEKDDTIRVSVFSPDGSNSQKICITRIQILLHLGPLQLQTMNLDNEVLPADRMLYLCLGATGEGQHKLGFQAVTDNAWLDTQASLTSDDNPQGAIAATPSMGVDQPLGSLWSLDCPVIEGDGPHEFSLNLLNQYTAEAFPIMASLGHHRLKFGAVQEAAYFPVREYRQSVRLGVQVLSYYTDQAVPNLEVSWGLWGHPQSTTSITDDEGWAWFDYLPQIDGKHLIEASVRSLYYASGRSAQALEVYALATDPWKDVRVVVEGNETPWDEKTGYPNRGSTYPVTLKLPEDSPLRDTDLWLMWEGDSSQQLGVTVSPALHERVPVTAFELTWNLTCEDRRDGTFDLLLGCSKLLLDSGKKPMSLARNVVSVGEVRGPNKSPVVDEHESVLLRVQVVHVTSNGPGDPVTNALVDWEVRGKTISTVTGAGGWASVLDTPTAHGTYIIIAKVRAHTEMRPIPHEFAVTALETSAWKDQAGFYLDDEPVELSTVGIVCQRGKPHTFRVTPKAGGPVAGKPMTLNWSAEDPGLGLKMGEPVETPAGDWEWSLSAEAGSSLSGLFELKLKSEGLQDARALSGRLLSANLEEEANVLLDRVSASIGSQTLYPCLGAVHGFHCLPHALSPLVGLQVKLKWSGTSADELGAIVEPALDQPQIISDGGALWALNFVGSEKNGRFALALELPQLKLASGANVMDLGHNKLRLQAQHDAAVDPVAGQDRAWLWVQAVSAFTRQPVAQVPVAWAAAGASAVVSTDTEGWSGYGFAPLTQGQYPIEARVVSPYDGYEEKRSLTVNALASDPWAELEVRFDGQPSRRWGSFTFFPRRKGEHFIEVSAPQGSVLLDQFVTLGLTGTGPAELGVSFVPATALGVPRQLTSEGLSYTLKGGDLKDGSFSLRLAAERLQNLSPANAMSLGVGSQVVKISASHLILQVLDWEQMLEEQVTVVSAVTGKPMVGWTVTWRSPDLGSVESRTDFYGVARIRFKPLTAGAAELTATVGDEVYSESVSLAFVVNEPREIKALVSVGQGAYPGEEGEAQATVVSALTGQPLSDVEVMWDFAGFSLTPTRTDAEGKASVRFRLEMPGDAVLVASVRGGLGGWDMASLLFTTLEDALLLDDLFTERPTIFLGETGVFRTRAVYSRTGFVAQNIWVNWSFPHLQLLPSLTDTDGVASVEFKPANIGTFDLIATTSGSSPASKSLAFMVLDPLTDPTHAKVAAVTASKNPVGVREYVTFTARIVATVSGETMPNREVFYSVAESSYLPATTDHKGELSRIYSPIEAGSLRFVVELRNPGGDTESGGVTVTVESLLEPESRI